MWHFDVQKEGVPGLILVLGCAQAGILWVLLAQFHPWASCQNLLLKLMNSWSCLFQLSGPFAPPCQFGLLSTTLFGAADPSDSLPHIPSSLTGLYSVSTPCRDQGILLPFHVTLPSLSSWGHSRSMLQSSSLLKSQLGKRAKPLPSVPQFTAKVPDQVDFVIFLPPLTPLLHPSPQPLPPHLSRQDGTYFSPLSCVLLPPDFH